MSSCNVWKERREEWEEKVKRKRRWGVGFAVTSFWKKFWEHEGLLVGSFWSPQHLCLGSSSNTLASCHWGSVCPGRTCPLIQRVHLWWLSCKCPTGWLQGASSYCLPLLWPCSGSADRQRVEQAREAVSAVGLCDVMSQDDFIHIQNFGSWDAFLLVRVQRWAIGQLFLEATSWKRPVHNATRTSEVWWPWNRSKPGSSP